MLSAEPVAVSSVAMSSAEEAAALPLPPASLDTFSWLPDFDSPGITIALPPLAYSSSQSLDDCLLHPSLAKPNADADIDVSCCLRSHSFAVLSTHINALPSAADDEEKDSNDTADIATPAANPSQPPIPNSLASPEDDNMEVTILLNRLGLSFDFLTDPALNATADSPLYLSLGERDAVAAIPEHAVAVEDEPAAVHLPALPESPMNAAPLAPPLLPESEQCSSKSRTRRTSLVDMLKTRMSKCADVNGDNVVVVVVVEDGDNESSAIQPTRDLLPGEPELSHNSGDATTTTTNHSQMAALDETLAIALESPVPAIADTVDTAFATAVPAEPAVTSEMLQKDKEEEEAPANGAAEERNIITVAAIASDEPLALASSDVPPLLETTTPETFPQQNDGGAVAADTATAAAAADDSQPPPPPPPPTRPPIYHRHIDHRSSRILEGITRKVQHVRQTTSTVLRRSVGSRVSMRPATPHDVFQGSIIGLAGLRGCGLNDSEPEHKPQSDGSETQTQLPPQYSVSDGGPASIKPDDSTSAVGSDGSGVDANSASAELPPHAADRINELEEKLIDVAAARSTTAVNTSDDHTLNATSDKLNSNSNSISRKLFSVRHGTNAAVRNSVTRVKNIFTAKRSVAA